MAQPPRWRCGVHREQRLLPAREVPGLSSHREWLVALLRAARRSRDVDRRPLR